MLALADAHVAKLAGTREELAIFVEGDGHYPIGRVKSLFNAIAMMDVNVNIKNALVVAKKFQDTEDNVYQSALIEKIVLTYH